MRRYGQACPLARSLDLLGDRWALLIVRELLIRPCSFKVLHEILQGISTNLLTLRIKELVAHGLIQKASRNAPYQLTEAGENLRPAVYELIRWSYFHDLSTEEEDETPNPNWDLLTLRALQQRHPPKRLKAAINLTLSTRPFHLRTQNGRLEITLEHGPVAAAHILIDHEQFRAFCKTTTFPTQGTSIEGDEKIALAILKLFCVQDYREPRVPGSIR